MTDRWTIPSTYGHLRGVYANANALTTPRQDRLTFLWSAWADLSRANRKKLPALYPIAVAQVYAWAMSLTEELLRGPGGPLLAQAMSIKYPGHCTYCGKLPCVCRQELRPVPRLEMQSATHVEWTLTEWQTSLNATYGDVNRAAGIAQAINRLGEEISEVGSLLNHVDGFNDPLDEMQKNIALEMSDVMAWIFTTSSLLQVNVEVAVRALYKDGCPVCRSARCACRNFTERPGTGRLTHRFMPAEDIERLRA